MESYLALFEPDREAVGYVVTFSDFGYGVTQGETDAESMAMAQDLLMLTIGDHIRESSPYPRPSVIAAQSTVLSLSRRCNRRKSTSTMLSSIPVLQKQS